MNFPTAPSHYTPISIPLPSHRPGSRRQAPGQILFFDEADALFAKRTEVG